MGKDVAISIADLETVVAQLGSIIDEFNHATERSEDLESDIGNPYDRSELREKAQDFEERWDDKRNDLKKSLEKVKEHVDGVLKGFKDWDTDTAVAFTNSK